MLLEYLLDRIGALSPCSENQSMKPVSFILEHLPGEGTKEFTLDPADYAESFPTAFMVLPLPPGQSHTIVSSCCNKKLR